MKKILCLLMILIITGCGCNKKYTTNTCELVSDQSSSGYISYKTYKIYSTKDLVNKVEITEEIKSNKKDILDFFEKQLKTQYKEADKKYKGYKYSVKIKNSKVISKVTINYNKLDMDKYIKDNSAIKAYVNSDNKLTREGAIKMYETMQASCK